MSLRLLKLCCQSLPSYLCQSNRSKLMQWWCCCCLFMVLTLIVSTDYIAIRRLAQTVENLSWIHTKSIIKMNRPPLLPWSKETWTTRWSTQGRLSSTPIPRTPFLLLKAPASTLYEEKFGGDRNMFTVGVSCQLFRTDVVYYLHTSSSCSNTKSILTLSLYRCTAHEWWHGVSE